jgi:hypothetical protein
MTPQQILAFIRERTQVQTTEMSDAYIYQLMSHNYHSLWQEIVLLDENYWAWFWETNSIANVNQYPFLQPVEKTSSNTAAFWQLKVEKISIKYADMQIYPTLAQKKDRQFMDKDKKWYEENQRKLDPFYIINGNSVFIYPTPQETVINGITMYGIKKPYNLNQWTTNISDILIESEYHNLIAVSTVIDVYRERQRVDLAQEAESFFDREKNKMIKNISIRSLQPMKWNIPSLNTIDMVGFY